jgi:hypothetical protein
MGTNATGAMIVAGPGRVPQERLSQIQSSSPASRPAMIFG